jgi:hypothetical protein
MPETEVTPPAAAAAATAQAPKTLAQMSAFERRQHFIQKNAEEAERNRKTREQVEKAIIDALYDAEDPERVEWRKIIPAINKQFPTGNVEAVWNDLWNSDKIEAVDKGSTPNFYRLSSKLMRQIQRERDSRKTKK